jgi:hypothetical protein
MINIKKKIKKIALILGVRLISEREYKELKLQRNLAIKKMIQKTSQSSFNSGLTTVIFSRDRAMQLYLTLESLDNSINKKLVVFVLYKVSDKDHRESYKELISLDNYTNLDVHFVEEKHEFKGSLIEIFKKIRTDKLFFLTDDDVFIRTWDINEVWDLDAFKNILSLRHGLNITYSYNENLKIIQPEVILKKNYKGIYKFNWFNGTGEWSDPMSVDGHIYSTVEILNISLISDFRAPNTYEAALKTYADINKDGFCYARSVIINLPINIVQGEVKNKSGNISSEYLLNQWGQGLKIDYSDLRHISNVSTHKEYDVKFISR